MKNEAGLSPYEAHLTVHGNPSALRFMAATPPLYRNRKVSASYLRSKCFIEGNGKMFYIVVRSDNMENDKPAEQSMDFSVEIK